MKNFTSPRLSVAKTGSSARLTVTLRLDDERAATLEMIARAENKSVTDAVRTAIGEHIEARRQDKAFMDRLKARHERERELYDRLAT
jgi:hypothetical protein